MLGETWLLICMTKDSNKIRIRGARQNNLKNINLDIETNTWTVITGPSGSGKSSLAFDTLYCEGQRLYVETFSSYARQFLEKCDRPDVDSIEGVPPAIAINQSNSVRTSRSTVGTMTELNDYIKLLFEKEARLFCKNCGQPVRRMSPMDMWADICSRAASASDPRLVITFDVLVPNNFDRELAVNGLTARGFTRIYAERKTQNGTILSVVADRFRASKADLSRGLEAVQTALTSGKDTFAGKFVVHALSDDGKETVWPYATGLKCAACDITYSDATNSTFSFNSPLGACPVCHGFGRIIDIDEALVIPDANKTLKERCIKPWSKDSAYSDCYDSLITCARKARIPVNVPYCQLTEQQKHWVWNGDANWRPGDRNLWYGIRHFFSYITEKAKYNFTARMFLMHYRTYVTCSACGGARLKPEALLWRIGSRAAADVGLAGRLRFVPNDAPGIRKVIDSIPGLTLYDLMLLPITSLIAFLRVFREEVIDEPGRLVLEQALTRLNYLTDVGVGYLTLDRQSRTLSGGEVQRVNLTTALGTNLVDTLFVLDEPSVGLHPRDMDRVNGILRRLRDAGNTLVVVEHDPQVMLAADRIVDMGPGSGEKGGEIVFDGTPKTIRHASTLTGEYLSGQRRVDAGLTRKTPTTQTRWLEIADACEHNLRNITVRFPIGYLTTVTGVSGSGKSTLIIDTLVPLLQRHFGKAVSSVPAAKIGGYEEFKDIHLIDQSAISATTRSTPVIYIDAFDSIRDLFAATPKARARGYSASYFSFNSAYGQCPTCQGTGFEHVEMQFLSDIYLKCPNCNGKRYRPEILEVTINLDGQRDVSIADVLDMTVTQALEYFKKHQSICRRLSALKDVGLDYIRLGQPLPTLSGGESQRLKLAEALAGANSLLSVGGHLFVLDEPTTGLHFDDISKLLTSLRRLIDGGATVILIEHNLDVINASDWIIDLGPDGGDKGGQLVAAGTPDGLTHKTTFTAKALAAYRKALEDPNASMADLSGPASQVTTAPVMGRSLQSFWRKARPGDMGIFGAREHNLKNLNVVVPKKKLTVVTGVSGSGKSTLAFGIIFSEGQRRYLESLNAYARSLVQPPAKPNVEQIIGIAPTVAIEQRTSRGGLKSTVGTMTEIHPYLRLLFTKLGLPHCPNCGKVVEKKNEEAICQEILRKFEGQRITLTIALSTPENPSYSSEIKKLAREIGSSRLYADRQWTDIRDFDWFWFDDDSTIDLAIQTLVVTSENASLLRRALSRAFLYGQGLVTVRWGRLSDGGEKELRSGIQRFTTKRMCPDCLIEIPEPDPRLFSYNSAIGWCPVCTGTGQVYGSEDPCPGCQGLRLNNTALSFLFQGHNIGQICSMSVDECLAFFSQMRLTGRTKTVGQGAVQEIVTRLRFLHEVGLGYLSLNRSAPTLSGGEAQRIRLASQIGNSLQGVCYVLDEPTIGLHARDNARLIDGLIALKNKGNTVIVVEHDEDMIRHAEHIVDIGPGAGSRGGSLVAEGTLSDITAAPESVTGQCLKNPMPHSGRARHPVKKGDAFIRVCGVEKHNLKKINVQIPLGKLVALTGVSGSGKSTLARDVLLPLLKMRLSNKPNAHAATYFGCHSILGWETLHRVLEVDQTPIGKTPSSCPATYVGFFTQIRELFASTTTAKEHGWTLSRFSFNTEDGRCPTCSGRGEVTVEMNFLPDVSMTCPTCRGKRFDEETLSALWHGKSIGDVLQMSVDEALPLFETSSKVAEGLRMMQAVGLGYLKLGQPSTTLSGGEAQRIKLVFELAKAKTSRRTNRRIQTLYILDEPTVGLHMADVEKLIHVLQALTDAGHTVLVIEHNLDLIAEADYVIDLGPEGGDAGGQIVAKGSPLAVSKTQTATGVALKAFFAEHPVQSSRNKETNSCKFT